MSATTLKAGDRIVHREHPGALATGAEIIEITPAGRIGVSCRHGVIYYANEAEIGILEKLEPYRRPVPPSPSPAAGPEAPKPSTSAEDEAKLATAGGDKTQN